MLNDWVTASGRLRTTTQDQILEGLTELCAGRVRALLEGKPQSPVVSFVSPGHRGEFTYDKGLVKKRVWGPRTRGYGSVRHKPQCESLEQAELRKRENAHSATPVSLYVPDCLVMSPELIKTPVPPPV